MHDRELTRGGNGQPRSLRGDAWRGGRFRAPDRLLVFLACGQAEADQLQQAWSGQAIDIESNSDLAVALVRIGQVGPALVVLGDSGGVLGPVEFLNALRQVDAATPVIVGLGRDSSQLGSDALNAGATAVVRRPFSPEALLRMLDSGVTGSGAFRVRPLPIDLGRLKVDGSAARIWVDGAERLIPAMEFVLLRFLAERHGEIVTRRELVSAAWGEEAQVPSNSLNVHLARLRRRFPADSGEDWIRPVRGVGYQFVVPRGVPAQHAAAGS